MLNTFMALLFGPKEPTKPQNDPLLAAASRIIALLPDLTDENGRIRADARLNLCRILFYADMTHIGEHGLSFLHESPEATTLGPLHPRLYDLSRKSWLFQTQRYEPLRADAARHIDNACAQLGPLTAGQIVAVTHWKGGAWAKRYGPSNLKLERGTIISIRDLAEEYSTRCHEVSKPSATAA